MQENQRFTPFLHVKRKVNSKLTSRRLLKLPHYFVEDYREHIIILVSLSRRKYMHGKVRKVKVCIHWHTFATQLS